MAIYICIAALLHSMYLLYHNLAFEF